MESSDKQAEHCREKTARGNIFKCKAVAKNLDSRIKKDGSPHVRAYRCPICGYYHVGKPGSAVLERQTRNIVRKGGIGNV